MLRLNIVTPERPFLKEECLSVTVPGVMGQMQILPGHAPVLAETRSGILTVQKANQDEVVCMVGEGFLEVDHDQVNVICEQARFKSEVNKEQEEILLLDLKNKIDKLDQDEVEQKRLFAELSRCAARINLIE